MSTVLGLRDERMAPDFLKVHVEGLPIPAVFHHFTHPDRGPCHDHPWPFRSIILTGGYVEEVFDPNLSGSSYLVRREPGDSFFILAAHIHRIVELPRGDCWTLILPAGPTERTSGFWEFREDGPWHRPWNRPDFERVPLP